MHIHSLFLKNFRNYKEQHFAFGSQVNMICGPNARGKTTLLEAIHLMMTGRSFRTQRLKELIQYLQSGFYSEIAFVKHDVEQTLRISYDGKERKIFYNYTPCRSILALIGVVYGTVMLPDDVLIIKGAPALRRKFLDMQLAQADPLYVHYLTRYQRALSCRNILLKKRQIEAMDIWEQELAKGAAYIVEKRYFAIECLQKLSQEALNKLSVNSENLQLKYKSQCPQKEKEKSCLYLDLYRKLRSREVQLGTTLVGPHKDDMQIFINEKDSRYFCSEGQQRSCVQALRLGEWEHLKSLTDEEPLMLIDDLGISLDGVRRKKLMEQVEGLKQVFVTTTEPLDSFQSGLNVMRIP